ncbi:hypothetical protein PoB_005520800 [Plakobranchus ocellatus]|uniref:Uncharacterized protein n=1 Tax=Plakobranchus ocellatus TaxID=259542 RepID=A0AAV4CA02_9GAST|nr:hypothetical protein PoB_005520800 [Plakobranchus ocellatus]
MSLANAPQSTPADRKLAVTFCSYYFLHRAAINKDGTWTSGKGTLLKHACIRTVVYKRATPDGTGLHKYKEEEESKRQRWGRIYRQGRSLRDGETD